MLWTHWEVRPKNAEWLHRLRSWIPTGCLAPDFSSDGHVSPAILVCDTSSALQLSAYATVRSTSAPSNVPMQMILSEAGSQSPTTRRLYTPIDVTRDLWSKPPEIYGPDNLKYIFLLLWTHFYICKWSMMGNWVFKFWVLKKCLLFVQGVFVPWPSPNKLKYEKPRLGESTLALIALYTFNLYWSLVWQVIRT